MRTNLHLYVKQHWRYLLASFFIPFFIVAFAYLSIGIYPGSSRSVLASDAFSQFSNFHASFNNVLHGKQNLFYTWSASLGLNYLSLVSYYLGGLFTPIVFFFDNQNIPDALYLITLLKISSAGLAFWFFASKTYRIPLWGNVALSVSYALMSFSTAHSELIMWLDAFIYLPLVILSIHCLMDRQKITGLFLSYLCLFITNFYMGFIIGVFSVLYYLARLLTNWKRYKKSMFPYLMTSLLAGSASMIMILQAIIDLRSNGEKLSQITSFKVSQTGIFDMVMKNMIGVYDTTKYGSIPFIYIGLFPLLLCIFYFISKQIPRKNKFFFGGIFVILIASFYIMPMNLFWHGMHAPNMFLFRFSFLFSFLVILLAGYGWEILQEDQLGKFVGGALMLAATFALAQGVKSAEQYTFVTLLSFLLSICFVFFYITAVAFYQLKKIPLTYLAILLLLLVSAEAFINTSAMFNGILKDWNYASRSLYSAPYPDIQQLVARTKKESDTFYRLENIDPISANDALNYGYSGISLFSSIRNRHSSHYLNELGFRSRGTNLNIRYQNNTLLMDTLFNIKYNLSKNALQKFGFSEIDSAGEYTLAENAYALPLGLLTTADIFSVKQPKNDNLGSQTNLFNALSEQQLTYYRFFQPTMIEQKNMTTEHQNGVVTYKEIESDIATEITWQVAVPAKTQAYLSLFPTDYAQISRTKVTVTVNGWANEESMNIVGQYYNLGYYEQATQVLVTASFYGSAEVSLMTPKIVGLDIAAFETAFQALKQNGVDFTVNGRHASATFTAQEEQVLFTTIPYDQGWTAFVDGEKVPIHKFKNALISIPVSSGTHVIELRYLPVGWILGVILFIGSSFCFFIYRMWYGKQTKKTLL